jgi:hypothetical protein
MPLGCISSGQDTSIKLNASPLRDTPMIIGYNGNLSDMNGFESMVVVVIFVIE